MTDPEPNQRLGCLLETPIAGEIVRAFVPAAAAADSTYRYLSMCSCC